MGGQEKSKRGLLPHPGSPGSAKTPESSSSVVVSGNPGQEEVAARNPSCFQGLSEAFPRPPEASGAETLPNLGRAPCLVSGPGKAIAARSLGHLPSSPQALGTPLCHDPAPGKGDTGPQVGSDYPRGGKLLPCSFWGLRPNNRGWQRGRGGLLLLPLCWGWGSATAAAARVLGACSQCGGPVRRSMKPVVYHPVQRQGKPPALTKSGERPPWALRALERWSSMSRDCLVRWSLAGFRATP